MIPYEEPNFIKSAFNCPICGAFSKQNWSSALGAKYEKSTGWSITQKTDALSFSTCEHCEKQSFWVNAVMVYPHESTAPFPNEDMPEDVKVDYEEARNILMGSPRGAAALLRLAVQKLCIALGEKGEHINDDIASLVKKGLPVKLQQALDSVRVVGNNAVHPGQIDLTDDIETATKLFIFVNVICDNQISQPRIIDDFYTSVVPEKDRTNIGKRDSK